MRNYQIGYMIGGVFLIYTHIDANNTYHFRHNIGLKYKLSQARKRIKYFNSNHTHICDTCQSAFPLQESDILHINYNKY